MASWQGERARVLQMKNQRFLFPAEQQRTAEDDPLGKGWSARAVHTTVLKYVPVSLMDDVFSQTE
jgi:hypothetical protein